MSENILCPKCRLFNNPEHDKCWSCKCPLPKNESLEAITPVVEKKTHKQENTNDAVLTESLKKIKLTTSYQLANEIISEEIEIITAEVVYGMNIFKDIFSSVRDIVGGRSASVQNILKDSRNTVLLELKKEALSIGADAVISVDLDYQELSGGGKGGMIMLVASGTAVILEK